MGGVSILLGIHKNNIREGEPHGSKGPHRHLWCHLKQCLRPVPMTCLLACLAPVWATARALAWVKSSGDGGSGDLCCRTAVPCPTLQSHTCSFGRQGGGLAPLYPSQTAAPWWTRAVAAAVPCSAWSTACPPPTHPRGVRTPVARARARSPCESIKGRGYPACPLAWQCLTPPATLYSTCGTLYVLVWGAHPHS